MTDDRTPAPYPFDTDVTDRLLSTTRAVRERLDLDRPVSNRSFGTEFRPAERTPVERLTYWNQWQ